MQWYALLGIAVGLALDAFAVAVATSVMLPRLTGRHIFRFAFHFGLFQAVMPVLGWLVGRSVVHRVAACDHWIAFGLLAYVGGKAIWEALRPGRDAEEEKDALAKDPTRGISLIMLSVATSIDALAVGLSLGVLKVGIWVPAVVIGVITAALTTVGMFLGRQLGARFGRRMAVVGGVVLLAIGVKILIDHLG